MINKIKKTTINELAENWNCWMNKQRAKGFTIGRGTKLYYWISLTKNMKYRVCPDEYHPALGTTLGWPRFIEPDQEINIHYENDKQD